VQEQYVFVHDAVVVMFKRHLELMQEHGDYCNITSLKPTVRFLGFSRFLYTFPTRNVVNIAIMSLF